MPATPAVALVWPIMVFTEPTTAWDGRLPTSRNSAVVLSSSAVSPATVPVP